MNTMLKILGENAITVEDLEKFLEIATEEGLGQETDLMIRIKNSVKIAKIHRVKEQFNTDILEIYNS